MTEVEKEVTAEVAEAEVEEVVQEKEAKSDAPEDKPAAPEDKPAAPEDKPAAPEDKPAAPEDKPAAPEDKPAAPEDKPAAPESNGGSEEGGGGRIKAEEETSSDGREPCRDYTKGICTRGSRCKFYHPTGAATRSAALDEVDFCLDYQNQGCTRDKCRFVHAYADDTERFKVSGEVTVHLARAIAAVTQKDKINGIPFCREYEAGGCSRGTRCRYWHISREEERNIRDSGGDSRRPGYRGGYNPSGYNPRDEFNGGGGGGGVPAFDAGFGGAPPFKRGRFAGPPDVYVIELERRNAELMQDNESLKRELKREQERYEDLYYLFRRETAPPGASYNPNLPTPSVPASFAPKPRVAGWANV